MCLLPRAWYRGGVVQRGGARVLQGSGLYRISPKMCRSAGAPRTGAPYGVLITGTGLLAGSTDPSRVFSLAAPFPSHIGCGLRFAVSGVFAGRLSPLVGGARP